MRVLGFVVAQDVGRALNPALVEGQMRGGAVQGIGWALLEELIHDDDGQLLSGSFLDYALPRAAQVPDIDTVIVEVPAPDGPFGAKGIGEARVIPAGAAVASAIVAAGGPRMRELPMTPRGVGGPAGRRSPVVSVPAIIHPGAVIHYWDHLVITLRDGGP